MKKYIILIYLIATFTLSCGSSAKLIEEPEDDKCILIGSIILEIEGYKNRYITAMEDIEVAIVGRYYSEGKEKSFGRWVRTDESGYFFIPNVPQGDFAIRGIQFTDISTGEIQIVNQLLDPTRDYYELNRGDIITLVGLRFDVASNQGVVNMKHNIFNLYTNELIDHKRVNELKDYKSVEGSLIYSSPVPLYFQEILQGTGWEKYLNMQY